MYYWQSEAPQKYVPEGDWNRERERYGSYDGTVKPQRRYKAKGRSNEETLKIEIGYGIRKEVVNRRLRAGWSYEDAVNTPLSPRRTQASKVIYIGCQRFTFAEFARYIGVTYSQLNYKFRKDAISKTHWQEQEVARLVENWYEQSSSEVLKNGL